MSPSKEAVAAAEVFEKLQKTNRSIAVDGLAYHGIILASTLRASEARAELLERQYSELLQAWRDDGPHPLRDTVYDVVPRHAREREALE